MKTFTFRPGAGIGTESARRRLYALVGLLACLVTAAALGQPATPPIPTTEYSRGLLTNGTAALSRAYLGISSGGMLSQNATNDLPYVYSVETGLWYPLSAVTNLDGTIGMALGQSGVGSTNWDDVSLVAYVSAASLTNAAGWLAWADGIWDSGTNRIASGGFIGDGSGLTNVSGSGTAGDAVSLYSPAVKAAFKQPPVVTPRVPGPFTNALMGWFSWNNNQCPDEAYFTNQVNAMVSLGMLAAGYNVVCFDAPWQEGVNGDGYPLMNTNRFPSGMAYLSQYARDRGFYFGVWMPASLHTNNIAYVGCTTNWQGAGGYEVQTAHYLSTNFVQVVVWDNFWSSGFDTHLQTVIGEMNAHAATNGRPVYHKTIGYGSWFPDFATNVHAMRVATDITTNWGDVAKQFNAWEAAADHVGPGGCIPDMDMLEIGNGMINPDADVTHFSIWAVSGTPLMLGMNLTNIASYVRQTVTNADMIRIHQDPGQYPGRMVRRTRVPGGTHDIWFKPLGWPGSGTNVVLVVNNSTNIGYIPFRLSEFGLGTNNQVQCVTPLAATNHGTVLDYFRFKIFYPYQSRCYLVTSDPSSNHVVGAFTDYLVQGDTNAMLQGLDVTNGNVTLMLRTNAPSRSLWVGTNGFGLGTPWLTVSNGVTSGKFAGTAAGLSVSNLTVTGTLTLNNVATVNNGGATKVIPDGVYTAVATIACPTNSRTAVFLDFAINSSSTDPTNNATSVGRIVVQVAGGVGGTVASYNEFAGVYNSTVGNYDGVSNPIALAPGWALTNSATGTTLYTTYSFAGAADACTNHTMHVLNVQNLSTNTVTLFP